MAEHLEEVKATDADALLAEAEAAIQAKDQVRACAIVHRYGELGHPPRPVFDLLLKYAISEDGALHAEKYYRTVSRGVRRDAAGVPLAAARGPGPRHGQRVRLPGPGLCGGVSVAQSVTLADSVA